MFCCVTGRDSLKFFFNDTFSMKWDLLFLTDTFSTVFMGLMYLLTLES